MKGKRKKATSALSIRSCTCCRGELEYNGKNEIILKIPYPDENDVDCWQKYKSLWCQMNSTL